MKNENFIVLSLGGSLMVPDQIDIAFLRQFRTLLRGEIRRGYRFMIFTGGGKVCRTYQDAARKLGRPTAEDLDWIGIRTTHLNGELLRVVLQPNVATALLPVRMQRSIAPRTPYLASGEGIVRWSLRMVRR